MNTVAAKQVAEFVHLCAREYREQDARGMTEYNFDEWYPFIGEMSLKICGITPPDKERL